jgi:hypothetical protein
MLPLGRRQLLDSEQILNDMQQDSSSAGFTTILFLSGASSKVAWPPRSLMHLQASAVRAAHASSIVDMENALVNVDLVVGGVKLTQVPSVNPGVVHAVCYQICIVPACLRAPACKCSKRWRENVG